MVRLTDRPDMTLDVYRGRKTTTTIIIMLLYMCYIHTYRVLRKFEDITVSLITSEIMITES